jgi:hypothetical protein
LQESDDAKNVALLRHHYKPENPDKWDDDTFANRLAELEYVLKKLGILTDGSQ